MKGINQNTLDRIVARATQKTHIHGAVFHVQSRDRSIDLISSSGNLKPESGYFIASINKMILSFITLRFDRDKKLNLDERISSYFSTQELSKLLVFKGTDYSNEITISHLITQTSGLPCYLIDKRSDGLKNMDLIKNGENQSWPLEKVMSEVKRMPAKYRPGSPGKANYSETNFRLLGKILEAVSGTSLHDLLTGFFTEFKMKDTFVLPGAADVYAPIWYKNSELDISSYWLSTHHDIASTAKDQMIFLRAFFDGIFFSDEEINALKKWNPIFFPFKYGTGIQKFFIPRILSPFHQFPETIGHCGSIGSVAFYIPPKELYITGTVNQTSSPNLAFRVMVNIINRF